MQGKVARLYFLYLYIIVHLDHLVLFIELRVNRKKVLIYTILEKISRVNIFPLVHNYGKTIKFARRHKEITIQ